MTERKLAEVALGLQKEAGAMGVAKAVGKKMTDIAVDKVLPAATLAGLAAVGHQVMQNKNALTTQNQFNHALAYAVDNNTILSGANRDTVQNIAQSVYNLAPNAASDPNVLSSVLANAVHGDGLDPRTARDLMDLEEKHHKVRQLSGINVMDVAKFGIGGPSWREGYVPDNALPAPGNTGK